MNMGICCVSEMDLVGCMTGLLIPTVHLADLGSAAAPDNERQAPYSSVGQVGVLFEHLQLESENSDGRSSHFTRTQEAYSACMPSVKLRMAVRARSLPPGTYTMSSAESAQT